MQFSEILPLKYRSVLTHTCRRSQDFRWGAFLFLEKSWRHFLVVAIKTAKTTKLTHRPDLSNSLEKFDSHSAWGGLTTFSCKFGPPNFFLRPVGGGYAYMCLRPLANYLNVARVDSSSSTIARSSLALEHRQCNFSHCGFKSINIRNHLQQLINNRSPKRRISSRLVRNRRKLILRRCGRCTRRCGQASVSSTL